MRPGASAAARNITAPPASAPARQAASAGHAMRGRNAASHVSSTSGTTKNSVASASPQPLPPRATWLR